MSYMFYFTAMLTYQDIDQDQDQNQDLDQYQHQDKSEDQESTDDSDDLDSQNFPTASLKACKGIALGRIKAFQDMEKSGGKSSQSSPPSKQRSKEKSPAAPHMKPPPTKAEAREVTEYCYTFTLLLGFVIIHFCANFMFVWLRCRWFKTVATIRFLCISATELELRA